MLGPSSEVPTHGLLPPQRRSGTPRRDRSRRRWRPVPCSAHRLPCSIPAARAMALPPPSKVKSTPAEHPPPGPSSSSSSSSSASCLGAREGGRRRGGPTWTVQPFSRRTRKADLPLPRTACTRPRTSTAAPARAAVSAPTSVHTFPVSACDCTRGAGPYLPAASSGSLGSSTTCAALPPVSPRPPARGRPRPRRRAPAGAEREAERAGRAGAGGRGREGGTDLLLDAALDLGLLVLALLALLLAAARGRAGVHQRLQVHPLAQGPLVEPGCHCSRPRRAAAPRSSSGTRRRSWGYGGGGWMRPSRCARRAARRCCCVPAL